MRRAVAANPHAPANLLASLAEDNDGLVRQAVAFNGASPTSVLVDLAGRSIDLALLVALNPDTPDEVLDLLANDSEPLVRFMATGMRTRRRALITPITSHASRPTVAGGAFYVVPSPGLWTSWSCSQPCVVTGPTGRLRTSSRAPRTAV